ncbi:MAG: zinc-dependent alcohol dehydrogenase family protein [Calditrichaeota bacterium]|nr:zinc-dependent alcohol dehydrogenase family protein [Calditrichota bacterium]
MTRAVKFQKYGGPEVLKIESIDQTEPAAGEVRVQMKVLALNRANSLFRNGTYLFEASFPSRIGTEGVGIIDAIGEDVSDFQVGQRVNFLPPENESEGGYAADFNIVRKEFLLPAPDGLNDRQAATAWVPFLTLYHLFVEKGLAARGHWVVLPAASSSVSLAANNLAHHLGAKTIGLTRTSRKAQALKAVGYDAVVISEGEDVSARILEITGDGADFVFDPVGGSQLKKLAASVKPGASINVYGLLDQEPTALPIFELMKSGATLSCYTVYELMTNPQRLREAIEYFLPLFKSGKLAPMVDESEYSLDQIVEAFQHLESNTQFGKVIVKF